MSTRTDIKIKSKYGECWSYRHHDGNPECTLLSLAEFMCRGDIGRAEGTLASLIIYGNEEYGGKEKLGLSSGSYEVSNGPCGDAEWRYEIDTVEESIKVIELPVRRRPEEFELGTLTEFTPKALEAFLKEIKREAPEEYLEAYRTAVAPKEPEPEAKKEDSRILRQLNFSLVALGS